MCQNIRFLSPRLTHFEISINGNQFLDYSAFFLTAVQSFKYNYLFEGKKSVDCDNESSVSQYTNADILNSSKNANDIAFDEMTEDSLELDDLSMDSNNNLINNLKRGNDIKNNVVSTVDDNHLILKNKNTFNNVYGNFDIINKDLPFRRSKKKVSTVLTKVIKQFKNKHQNLTNVVAVDIISSDSE
jgi:hypothetical protein